MTSPIRPLGAHTSIAGGVPRALDRAAEIDATAVQIFTHNQVQWRIRPLPSDEVTAFNRKLAAGRLRYVCAHASYLLNLASPDQELRRKSRLTLIEEMRRCHLLGCRCLVLHPGSPRHESAATGIKRIAEGLLQTLEETPSCDVHIALENTAGQGATLGGTPHDLARILDACQGHPGLSICLDTCHAFAAGHDIRTRQGLDTFLDEYRNAGILNRIEVLHLNDAAGTCGSRRDRHTHIGEGQIGIDGFKTILSHADLSNLPGIIETPKGDNPTQSDRDNLRRLAEIESGF